MALWRKYHRSGNEDGILLLISGNNLRISFVKFCVFHRMVFKSLGISCACFQQNVLWISQIILRISQDIFIHFRKKNAYYTELFVYFALHSVCFGKHFMFTQNFCVFCITFCVFQQTSFVFWESYFAPIRYRKNMTCLV